LGFLLIAKGSIAQILVTWSHVGGAFFLQILVAQSSRVVSRSDHVAGRNRGLLEKKIQMVLFPIVELQQKVLPLVMPFCWSFIQHHIPVSYTAEIFYFVPGPD
jgi:hypothetical protein